MIPTNIRRSMGANSDRSDSNNDYNFPMLSNLSLRILRDSMMNRFSEIVQLTVQYREIGFELDHEKSEGGNFMKSSIGDRLLKELQDSAASIISDILARPRLITDILKNSKGGFDLDLPVRLGFIAMNRLSHPFFGDSTTTTSLLFECLAYQTELRDSTLKDTNTDVAIQNNLNRLLFIDDSLFCNDWNHLEQPLPTKPSCRTETIFTTLLKLYSLRVDVVLFFRDLWKSVLPSIVAYIKMPQSSPLHNTSEYNRQVPNKTSPNLEKFKILIKIIMRLLLHTFSEKSLILWPATATSIARGLNLLCGSEGMTTMLLHLMIIPNLVKILSTSIAHYDSVGDLRMSVEDHYRYCSLDAWWPDEGFSDCNITSLSTIIWVVWRLFTAAATLTEVQIAGNCLL